MLRPMVGVCLAPTPATFALKRRALGKLFCERPVRVRASVIAETGTR